MLVFPTGKASTVGANTLYRLKHNDPLAVLNAECETITVVGCIIAEIPCVAHIPIQQIPSGSQARLEGTLVIVEKE